MKTEQYIGSGLHEVNGFDAWALMRCCVDGDFGLASELISTDSNLVNAQYWYEIPLHYAVRAGHEPIVRLLLDHGADPGTIAYAHQVWHDLLVIAEMRGHDQIKSLLETAMTTRFNYDPKFEALAEAIRRGNENRVITTLRANPGLMTKSDSDGNGPLHWAVMTHQMGLLEVLASMKADLNAVRADGKSPVLLAIHGDYGYRRSQVPKHRRRSKSDLVRMLMDHGAEMSLSVALWTQDESHVREMLTDNQALSNQLDSAHFSPLTYASLAGDSNLTDLLLQSGADPNQPEALAPAGGGLYYACASGNLDQCRILIDAGADPNGSVDSSGNCLYAASRQAGEEFEAITDLLENRGARKLMELCSIAELEDVIASTSSLNEHPGLITNVIDKGDMKLIELLLQKFPHFPREVDGRTFRTPSVDFTAKPEILDLLISSGFDINRGDCLGKTLLHYSAQFGDAEMTAYCLNHSAEINARELDFEGTPLATAARYGHWEIIEILLEHGADHDAPDDKPWARPLEQARHFGHTEIADRLKNIKN